MSVIVGSKVRPKLVLKHQGKPWKVRRVARIKTGKGGGYIRARIQSLEPDGPTIDERFSSSDTIEVYHVEARSAQYLYNEGSNSVFIDTEKDVGELISVPTSILDELIVLMEPGSEVKILYCDDQMVDVMLPDKIRCTVESLAPSGGTKYAYARGVRFAVPTYVEVGEEVVISTETGEFVERAKGA